MESISQVGDLEYPRMDNRFNMIVFVFYYLTDIIPSKIPSKAFTENINYVVSMPTLC